MAKTLIAFRDIGFSVLWSNHEDIDNFDFEIYQIECEDGQGSPMYHKKDSDSYPNPVYDTQEAEIYAHGTVKWDGCSNWEFDEQKRCMLHACDREQLVALGEVLARCWDIADPER